MTNTLPKSPSLPHLLMYVLQPSDRVRSFADTVRAEALKQGITPLIFDFHSEEGRRRFLEVLDNTQRREAFMRIYDLFVPENSREGSNRDPWPVDIDFGTRHLRVGPNSLTLEPMLLAVYAAFLAQKENCAEPACRVENDACDRRCFLSVVDMCRNGFPQKVSAFYRRVYGWGGQREESMLERLENGLESEAMRQYISKINRRLRTGLGDHPMLDHLLIVPIGRYGSTRYGLKLPRHAVPKAIMQE